MYVGKAGAGLLFEVSSFRVMHHGTGKIQLWVRGPWCFVCFMNSAHQLSFPDYLYDSTGSAMSTNPPPERLKGAITATGRNTIMPGASWRLCQRLRIYILI